MGKELDSQGTKAEVGNKSGKVHPEVLAARVKDVLSVLLMFRFVNALCTHTFFQPDEYFQALEPAWSIAFGNDSGAWLTWVRFFCILSRVFFAN